MLPYLPRFRPMFESLPTDASQVKSGMTQVMLEDIECVTTTSVKIKGQAWTIQLPPGMTLNFV